MLSDACREKGLNFDDVVAALGDSTDAASAEGLDIGRMTLTQLCICGQAPSDYPEFARFLVVHIDSISLNPDAVQHNR